MGCATFTSWMPRRCERWPSNGRGSTPPGQTPPGSTPPDRAGILAPVTGGSDSPQRRSIRIFPNAPSAVDGVAAGRVSAYAGTALTVNDLLAKTSSALERARPFTDLVIDGEVVKGYGAFGCRKHDTRLRGAFNQVLGATAGTEKHVELVTPFGFTREMMPGGVTAAELCEAS